MKLTKEQLKQIIVEELREVRGVDKRDVALTLAYASRFIIGMRDTIERLIKAAGYDTNRPQEWQFNIGTGPAKDAKIYKLLKMAGNDAWDAYASVKESEDVHMSEDFQAMRDVANEDLKYYFKNRQLYDACLWIVKILNSTPGAPNMSALEAMQHAGYRPTGLYNFEEKLEEVLNNDKLTQMLFDYYEAGHGKTIVPW